MTLGTYCGDSDALLSYLYGEADPDTQRAMEAHLRSCRSCAEELDGLTDIRGALQAWVPPEHASVSLPLSAATQASRRWSSVPAWAAAVAAMLVLAAGAAVANLQVRIGNGELRVSSGWSRTAATEMAEAPAAVSDEDDAEWRAAVAAVREELRLEIEAARTAAGDASVASVPTAAVDNVAVLRRVQALIEQSEQRQREELAFRLTQASRDFEVQRHADLGRIEQEFGSVAGRADVEAAQNRQLLNYLVRVSGQTPQ